MTAKLTLDELLKKQNVFASYVGHEIQHVSTGGWYFISGLCFREHDMVLCFIYTTLHRKPVTFCRPVAEVVDGRFTIGAKHE